MALAALAGSTASPSHVFVGAAHVASNNNHNRPSSSSITKHAKRNNNKKHHPPKRGVGENSGGSSSWTDAAVAAEGVIFRSSDNGGNGDGSSGRAVIVQPDWIGGAQHPSHSESTVERQRATGELHPWPHPDTFREETALGNRRESRRRGSDWAGDPVRYGQAIEYYQNGRPLQSSNGSGNGGNGNPNDEPLQSNNLRASYSDNTGSSGGNYDNGVSFEQWLAMQSAYNNDDNPNTNFEEWMQDQKYGSSRNAAHSSSHGGHAGHSAHVANYKSPARAMGAPLGAPLQQLAEGQPNRPNAKLPTPMEDLDVVSGKQVILRPRLDNEMDSNSKQLVPPPMGSSAASAGQSSVEVYYYDPQTLRSSSSSSSNHGASRNNGQIDAPELTLPEIVYTASGRALPLAQLHAGGRNEVFLEVRPKSVWGADLASLDQNLGRLRDKLSLRSSSAGSAGDAGGQSQDQLIVFFTVATMAVMVGALSAKRLRSKKLLESCLHPEMDDDWDAEEEDLNASAGTAASRVRYDKKFDVGVRGGDGSVPASPESGSASGGFGALLGGRRDRVGYYGTAAGVGGGNGGLHWRGDMEKFDV